MVIIWTLLFSILQSNIARRCLFVKKRCSLQLCAFGCPNGHGSSGVLSGWLCIYERYIYIYKHIYTYTYICCFWWRYARPRKLIGLLTPKKERIVSQPTIFRTKLSGRVTIVMQPFLLFSEKIVAFKWWPTAWKTHGFPSDPTLEEGKRKKLVTLDQLPWRSSCVKKR